MNIITKAQGANLPTSYQHAKTALAECASIDECKDWADKAAALASYAKMAEDFELEQTAARIRARAMRRAGELLKQFDGRHGQNLPTSKKDASDHFSKTQKQAASDAGFSERQTKTAVRIANIPEQEFNEQVESQSPPTISTLALHGMQKRKPLDPQDWLKGRSPSGFNKALHFCGMIENYSEELAAADLDIALPNLDEQEVDEVRKLIAIIDKLHDQIITRI